MAILIICRKLKAFSIIESVVTMVIMLGVFFTGMYFLVSVNESAPGIQRIKAVSTLNTYIQQCFERKDFANRKTMMNNWPVSTESSPSPKTADVMQVSFTIYKREDPMTPIITRILLVETTTMTDPISP